MRKRIVLVGVLALLLVAAVPGVALAAGKGFSASGVLTRLPGPGPVAAAASQAKPYLTPVAQPFYDGLVSALPFGGDTPGQLHVGQNFTGRLDSSWGALKGAQVAVAQNSWLTADPATGEVYGIAWGAFQLTKGKGNYLSGLYSASLTGSMVPVESDECDSGLGVKFADAGMWMTNPYDTARGAFAKVDPTGALGDLMAATTVCIPGNEEIATVTIGGTR